MTYYRSKITGKIITEKAIRNLYDIYGKAPGNVVDDYVIKEVLEPFENPSLEQCLCYGNEGVAIIRYREMNEGTSFEEARDFVRTLSKKKTKNGNKNRKEKKQHDQ